jgi:hypothetical protein
VNDLPGGPAVNQLNLHPPVTKIAEAQHGLHWMLLIICTVIFILVFGVMFYSIWKHRKSQGAKAATFHESVAVEVAWTVVPFLIVIGMALPQALAHAAPDVPPEKYQELGLRYRYHYLQLPVEVGLRLHQRRGRGHRLFVHTGFVAARAVGRRHAPGRRLPAARRQPAGGAGRQEDPHHHHGQRRDPRLDGAGLRRQAGRDSGLRARHLVSCRADGRLLRSVRRAVRQGTRLHADPREGAAAE